jgi:hypothetical protein
MRGGDDPIGGIHEIMEKGLSESAPCRILFGGSLRGDCDEPEDVFAKDPTDGFIAKEGSRFPAGRIRLTPG